MSLSGPFIARAAVSAFVLMLAGFAGAQGLPLNYTGTGAEPPLITAVPADVCVGTQFYDGSGTLQMGTRTCGGPAACLADGQSACLVDGTNFRAAQMSTFTAASIKAGVTLAGVSGTGAFAPANCTADGQVGCQAASSFRAVNMSLAIPANIKDGIVIAGVTGGYPSSAYKLVDDSATIDLPGLEAGVPAGNFEWWKSDGTRKTGTISDVGAITVGMSNHTFNASVYRQFTVPGDSQLRPENIRSGISIFGIMGNYPSAAFPLPGASGMADLDGAAFDAKIKGAGTFEWWDSAGMRYSMSGAPAISPENLQVGTAVFGAVGTYGSACMYDGEVQCMTTASHPSIDVTNFNPMNLRAGKTAGGIAGGIHFHKNMATTGLFDRSTGTGAMAGLDIFDTIDDSANGGAFPTQNPAGWYQVTGSNWQRDVATDTGAGGGVASDGICNGTEPCVYKDKLTGLLWSKASNSMGSWETAISYCDNLMTGSYTDWRLPTQKELIQVYIDGIQLLKTSSKLDIVAGAKYWAATTYSMLTTNRYQIQLDNAAVAYTDANSGGNTLCVRP